MSLASSFARRALARAVSASGSSAAKASNSRLAATVAGPMAVRSMASLSAGAKLTALAKENPYKDVVRYEHKNRKWNLQHVDFYSESLAIGLLENGLQPGDVVLSWLPAHFSESVSMMCYQNLLTF
jgi:hypothetical protein